MGRAELVYLITDELDDGIGIQHIFAANLVSMDLTAVKVDPKADVAEGDWVELDYDLPEAAVQSGMSQYELLTTLGQRFKRTWI